MTTQQNNQDALESRLQEVQVENDLLLVQIHQLEEELEHYFMKNQELEKGQPAGSQGNGAQGKGWVDDELPDTLAENQRLHTLVEVQRKIHQLESQQALNVKLGNILIKGVESPGSFLSVPGKLGKIWRMSSRQTPPAVLGGKNFDKVIAAHSEGGFEGVEKLMAGVSQSEAMQANAYTALARHLMKSDRAGTAKAARLAYTLDPRPYRLKWLAFRLHETGEIIEAEAMLDSLPPDIQFSESEARQDSQLRYEAKHIRRSEAKLKTGFLERRTEVERQLNRLSREREEQANLAADRQAQIEQLTQAKTQEEEKSDLVLRQLFQVQEELENQYLKCQTLEQEKSVLVAQKDEQAYLVAARQAQVDLLTQSKAAEEAELGREIEALKLAQAQLEQEKSALAGQKETQAELAAARQAQVDLLTQSKAAEEAELGREIEALKQAQAQLEQEKAALAGQKEAQAELAAERLRKIDELQHQAQARQASEAELSIRQQMIHEEMVRAEAQLDLIKDVLLREPGL